MNVLPSATSVRRRPRGSGMGKRSGSGVAAAAIFAVLFAAISPAAAGTPTISTENPGNSVAATPALVRQVQFMLLSIGQDPGPIDGVPRRLTNTAVHKFEQQSGLPEADLVTEGQISTQFLDALRQAASGVLLGTQPRPPATSAATPQPAVAALPAPPSPPVDRFAACRFDPADFLIGDTQYTPKSFLQTGFGGSTAVAVDSLKGRLKEAQQVAQKIGGPALKEVQRQARVLSYFECRLSIEQAAAGKN
jgi:peptidoglycan hydrolase-like protein with peptidoglycan-binding domain